MFIGQNELERLKRAKQAKSEAEDRYQALRLDLIARYRGGAEVEPGCWSLKMRENVEHRITREGVEKNLGAQEAERLKRLMPGKLVTYLSVVPTDGRHAR